MLPELLGYVKDLILGSPVVVDLVIALPALRRQPDLQLVLPDPVVEAHYHTPLASGPGRLDRDQKMISLLNKSWSKS